MVNNHGIIIHKTDYKKGKQHDYDIYKKNHPVTPKEVVNVLDLGYLGIEKDFPEQLSSLPNKKKRNQQELSAKRKKNTTRAIQKKENSNRAYHLSIKKVQDTCKMYLETN